MANNLAITSVYSKTTKVLEPNQSGRLRSNKKHKDGVEVSVSKFKLNDKEKELLKTLQSMYG
jgi:hypothetical protein